MDIKLFMDLGPGSDNFRQLIEILIFQMAEKIGIKPENLKIIGVAPSEIFGKAMKELLPGIRRTDNSEDMAIGKTISRFKNKNPEHILVLNLIIFDSIFKVTEFARQELPDQFGLFVLSHELGHCKFNEVYNGIDPKFEEQYAKPNDVDSSNRHNLKVLIGEVGACFFGLRINSRDFLVYLYSQEHTRFSELLKKLTNSKQSKIPFDVAITANNIAWLYIIQYSKIAIGKSGTPIENELIPPFGGLQGLCQIHMNLNHALTEFTESGFKKLEDFESRLQLARNSIFDKLNVSLKKEGEAWSCYW